METSNSQFLLLDFSHYQHFANSFFLKTASLRYNSPANIVIHLKYKMKKNFSITSEGNPESFRNTSAIYSVLNLSATSNH